MLLKKRYVKVSKFSHLQAKIVGSMKVNWASKLVLPKMFSHATKSHGALWKRANKPRRPCPPKYAALFRYSIRRKT